jgi:hypothetical protein
MKDMDVPLDKEISIPLLASVQVDLGALSFTLFIAVVTGMMFGLVPALQVPSIGVSDSLKDSNRGSTGGKRHGMDSRLAGCHGGRIRMCAARWGRAANQKFC